MADISTIDLTLRSEVSSGLTQSQNDTNLTDIQTSVNAILGDVNALRRYGEMHLVENATATAVAADETWYTVQPSGVQSDHLNEVTFDNTNKGLIAPADGVYSVVVTGITAYGTANDIVHYGIGIGDGSTQVVDPDHIVNRKLGTQSDIGACSVGGTIDLTAGQVVTLEVYNASNSNDVTTANFTMKFQGVPA